MHFPVEIKMNCVTWLIKTKSSTKVQRNFLRTYGKNEKAPTIKTINKWLKVFPERGTLQEAKHQRKCTIDSREIIINISEDKPK